MWDVLLRKVGLTFLSFRMIRVFAKQDQKIIARYFLCITND